jgi:hypothetical protein
MKRTILLLFLLFIVMKTFGQNVRTDDSVRDSRFQASGTGHHSQLNDLVINEFMAGNDTFIQDPQGEYGDWLELYNRTGNTIDLTGMVLTDDPGTLKWEFPDTSMAPHGYLLIWIDDDEEDTPGLHASFNMNKDGEFIGLFDKSANGNAVIDSLTFGQQQEDVSYGRYPNGEGNFVFMDVPTPLAENVQHTAVTDENMDLPTDFQLLQNYPNPFNGQTIIPYVIHQPTHVRISVLNLRGQSIQILLDEFQASGNYHTAWNGVNSQGDQVPSGIYLIRLQVQDSVETKKMLLVQ